MAEEDARTEYLSTWGDLIRRYQLELTEKMWVVASLQYHRGFTPQQIADHFRRRGQPNTPRTVKAVYALLAKARQRCESAVLAEQARARVRAKKNVE